MWGQGLLTPTAKPIDSVAVKPIEPPTDEYQKLARKLGIAVARDMVSLEDILRDEMIHVYSMSHVSKYMSMQTPSGKIWGWLPCRKQDYKACRENRITFDGGRDGVFIDGVYSKPLPLPVLLTMDKVEEAARHAGLEIAFFVSDFAARRPDPFLMVTDPSGDCQYKTPDGSGRLYVANSEPDCFVIERWDEPSFR